MSDAVLKANHIVKQYPSFCFGPIDFELEPGSVVAFVGPNGSGKSTFFRLVMNLIQPDQGTIECFGKDLRQHELEIKQQIGYAASGLFDIFGHLTIKQLASLVSHWYPKWDERMFHELIVKYEIDLKKKYAKCSTGTRKKVDFVLSIAHHPSLLLLDEPSAGVDMMSQRKMKEDLLRFMDSGQNSVMIATHLQEEVKQVCDYVTVINRGKIVHSFEKDEAQQQWARLWVTSLPEHIVSHPNVKETVENPMRIVTDQLSVMEDILRKEGITITHTQRLHLNEVIEYCVAASENIRQ